MLVRGSRSNAGGGNRAVGQGEGAGNQERRVLPEPKKKMAKAHRKTAQLERPGLGGSKKRRPDSGKEGTNIGREKKRLLRRS